MESSCCFRATMWRLHRSAIEAFSTCRWWFHCPTEGDGSLFNGMLFSVDGCRLHNSALSDLEPFCKAHWIILLFLIHKTRMHSNQSSLKFKKWGSLRPSLKLGAGNAQVQKTSAKMASERQGVGFIDIFKKWSSHQISWILRTLGFVFKPRV